MKKRIFCAVVWALAFPAAYFVASSIAAVIVGKIGLPEQPPAGFTLFLGIWAWLFWLSPVIALVLSFYGVLPGTKRLRESA